MLYKIVDNDVKKCNKLEEKEAFSCDLNQTAKS